MPNHNHPDDVGQRRRIIAQIRAAMRLYRLRQSDLASLIGTQQSAVSEILTGTSDMQFNTLQRIFRGLRQSYALEVETPFGVIQLEVASRGGYWVSADALPSTAWRTRTVGAPSIRHSRVVPLFVTDSDVVRVPPPKRWQIQPARFVDPDHDPNTALCHLAASVMSARRSSALAE